MIDDVGNSYFDNDDAGFAAMGGGGPPTPNESGGGGAGDGGAAPTPILASPTNALPPSVTGDGPGAAAPDAGPTIASLHALIAHLVEENAALRHAPGLPCLLWWQTAGGGECICDFFFNFLNFFCIFCKFCIFLGLCFLCLFYFIASFALCPRCIPPGC